MKILLVDDCQDLRELVKNALKPLEVVEAEKIEKARSVLEDEVIDLILIDIELPDGSGFDFCSELSMSARFENIPKIIISGRDGVADKVFGLYGGADDYIVKPFASQELKARINVQTRKTNFSKKQIFINPLKFNHELQVCSLCIDDKELRFDFTPTEYRIVFSLVSNANTTLSRRDIVKDVWSSLGVVVEERGIDSHICRIRTKMASYGKSINSVYGRGYSYLSEGLNTILKNENEDHKYSQAS